MLLLQLLLFLAGCDQAPLRGLQPKASGSAGGSLLITVVPMVLRKTDGLWTILGATALELAAASTHVVSGS